MIRKTSKRRGTSVIAALVALCAVVGYGLTEWAPLDNEPQAVPALQREGRQTVREKVEIPDKGGARSSSDHECRQLLCS